MLSFSHKPNPARMLLAANAGRHDLCQWKYINFEVERDAKILVKRVEGVTLNIIQPMCITQHAIN